MEKVSEPGLKALNLTKNYGNTTGAIDISLEVNPGEIVGFIGPNGAGKTTTMRMLMGLVTPQSGHTEVFGKRITSHQQLVELKQKIGYLPGEVDFYSGFTAAELLHYSNQLVVGDFSGQIEELSKKLELDTNRKFRHLSLGNKKKVGVINALMHEPELLILDEPTSGLDPLVQQNVLDLLLQAKQRGAATLLSSHTLSEVEQICDRIIMIKQAKITISDDKDAILERALKRFRIKNEHEEVINQIHKDESKVIKKYENIGKDSLFYVENPSPILTLLAKHEVTDFFLERPSLEQMFIEEYRTA